MKTEARLRGIAHDLKPSVPAESSGFRPVIWFYRRSAFLAWLINARIQSLKC